MSLKERNKIFHLSIEGFDGVGKTTICEYIANKHNLCFITKPFHLLIEDENKIAVYQKIAKKINQLDDTNLTSWFYCFSYSYAYSLKKDIVTDRFLGSNYAWGGNNNNLSIYQESINKFGKPDITIVLYANKQELTRRIRSRDINDSNLCLLDNSENYYEKMIYFLKTFNFNYHVVDTNNKSIEQIYDEIKLLIEENKLKK
ncbi:MAG: AAA family ATPase [Ureaplasma sp.]|nr:AAA family ATPase [Ureaplasma sp.]